MFIILTYDVGAKRNSRVLKVCRKYLTHVQKSVFEGFLDERKFQKLKKSLANIIDFENYQTSIYKYGVSRKLEKEIIGYYISTTNIIY